MKTRHHLLNAATCLTAAARRLTVAFCACLALASCGSDDNNPDPEPPGTDPKQPLIITAEVHAAATTPDAIRAQWTDGDWVAVEVDGVVKRYIATPLCRQCRHRHPPPRRCRQHALLARRRRVQSESMALRTYRHEDLHRELRLEPPARKVVDTARV